MGSGFHLVAGDVDVVIGVIAIMVWLVVQGVRKAASGKRPGQAPPPMAGGAPGSSPEDELRRFLQELGQGAPPSEAPPKAPPPMPAAPRPPTATTPPARHPTVAAHKPRTVPPTQSTASRMPPPPPRTPARPPAPLTKPRPAAPVIAQPAPVLAAEPPPKEALAAVAALPPARPSRARLLMRKPDSVRQAIILGELLAGPVSLREGSTGVPVRPAAG